MATEVDDTLKRIQAHKGVVGTIVITADGVPVKSTLDNTTTVQYVSLITQLCDKARAAVRDLDPTNDLTFLRLRSKKHEIMIAPDKEEGDEEAQKKAKAATTRIRENEEDSLAFICITLLIFMIYNFQKVIYYITVFNNKEFLSFYIFLCQSMVTTFKIVVISE